MKIKNIIFDFGGVLIDWNPRYLYRNVFQDEAEMEYFLKDVCSTEWNIKQDAGRSLNEATEELVKEIPQYEKEIRNYYSDWVKMIGGAIEENAALIKDLKDKYRLFGLTNWSAETFPIVFDQYPFFKELEGIVVSGTEKIIKPDARIYQLLLTRYGLTANESLFIDDNQENINAANRLGFNTIPLLKGVNLKDELERLGL
ncbi:HAD family hydrolase [Labilibaculum euxinus]|uniref:HAD-IA family hydrolase n=1 Tax=Labilibaculum euxinus TaxID=2686357 RepID=A0A7M4D9Q4_9BACT|nr:HAD family phosphatase [Labilibaculum euxinus]MUP39383.1 HAD-IA family hydrolase [Labilibaculum euxinus]MVB08588.1 HAD-IA family hydrolase [Labilibaculum euxinus]